MKKLLTLTSFLTTAMVLAAGANAQTYTSGLGYAGSGYGYCGSYGGYGYHSSTAEEGILQGYASVLQASGQANYLNSLAAVNVEEARARYIKNRELATETFFRNRQINHAGREAERPIRLSPDQYSALAKMAAPERLSPQQYDTTFRRLSWPVALMGADFAKEREALDRMFFARSPNDSGNDSTFSSDVRQLTNSMQNTLKNHINELDAGQYVAAKKFLMGLSYESQQPMVVRAVALR